MEVFFTASGKSFPDFKMFNFSEQDKGTASNLPPVKYTLDWNLKQFQYFLSKIHDEETGQELYIKLFLLWFSTS